MSGLQYAIAERPQARMARVGGEVFAFGTGPGPKNVGVRFPDGSKVVYTYREYKKLMAETVYASVEGFIQFDPQVRDANGQKVTDVTVKTQGAEGKLVRVTIWPELAVDGLEKGDWLAADGKLTISSYEGKNGPAQSIQISASALAVVKGVKRQERGVVNEDGPKGADFKGF